LQASRDWESPNTNMHMVIRRCTRSLLPQKHQKNPLRVPCLARPCHLASSCALAPDGIERPTSPPNRAAYTKSTTGNLNGQDSLVHREHHAESRLAAHHAVVAGAGLFERQRFHHGANARVDAEIQCVFRIPGGP